MANAPLASAARPLFNVVLLLQNRRLFVCQESIARAEAVGWRGAWACACAGGVRVREIRRLSVLLAKMCARIGGCQYCRAVFSVPLNLHKQSTCGFTKRLYREGPRGAQKVLTTPNSRATQPPKVLTTCKSCAYFRATRFLRLHEHRGSLYYLHTTLRRVSGVLVLLAARPLWKEPTCPISSSTTLCAPTEKETRR